MNHMQEIIDFIKELVDEGYAYESDGDVYFRTRQFNGYGKLSHQSLDDLKVGARIEAGEQKEDALDFTLWKKAKPGEISWDSPFGEGRPGWHIECSVMAYHELGPTIDIHAGGSDLQFHTMKMKLPNQKHTITHHSLTIGCIMVLLISTMKK